MTWEKNVGGGGAVAIPPPFFLSFFLLLYLLQPLRPNSAPVPSFPSAFSLSLSLSFRWCQSGSPLNSTPLQKERKKQPNLFCRSASQSAAKNGMLRNEKKEKACMALKYCFLWKGDRIGASPLLTRPNQLDLFVRERHSLTLVDLFLSIFPLVFVLKD